MPSGRTSKFPLSGWQELPLPRAERGLTAAGRADFGNAIEVIRISDRSLLSIFAKNLELCNFRLLQHNRPDADLERGSLWHRF
jgi:hypothetical protein